MLNAYSIQQFSSYIGSKRIQRVVVDGEASMCSHVTSGVPQGTVLGPTLFLVFINDIADNLHSTARVFADDCVIYRPIHTEKDHQLMQEDLDTLVGWSDTWQMEFNAVNFIESIYMKIDRYIKDGHNQDPPYRKKKLN